MQNTPLKPPGSSTKPQGGSSPFAAALAEMEKQSSSGSSGDNNPFAEAMAQSGGVFDDSWADAFSDFGNPTAHQSQEEMLRQQREEAQKQRIRKELHDKINPVDAHDLFSARHEQVAREIDQLRAELKALAMDISKFHKEVDITLMSAVSDVGDEGKYYINFFQKLRALIILMRQRISSARTWMHQMQQKQAKKKRKHAPGMVVEGSEVDQTKTVFDTMHHERSNAYGG